MPKSLKFFSLIFAVSFFSIIGSMLVYQTKAQWQGPQSDPPLQNAPAPINVSSSNQQKIGGLTLGRDLYIDPISSNTSQAGIRFVSNSATGGLYGYLFNNLNTLQYNTQTATGEVKRFTIGNDGNVAIGNITPSAKLHVDGAIISNSIIQATGKIYSEGNEVLTSLSAEQDPKVGTLTNGQWCYSAGGQVVCSQNAPQARITGTCAVGNSIRVINQDGTVTCESVSAAGAELDPTVPAAIKDGISWGEITGVPGGFTDGVDNVGIASETDPIASAKIGALNASQWCSSDGTRINCNSAAPEAVYAP